ncbi:MAG: DEAD/DEAH box helicase, partial [Bacteroidales bacterium]
MTFKELNISEPILRALADKKYETPTPIQQQAIPVAMSGKDMLGVAQTGTGKTAAFAIPIIEHLSSAYNENRGKRQIKALVLTPTRELAIQIEEAFADYGKYSGLKHTVVYGGVSQKPQTDKLSRGTDILIATPGRLLDLISQRYVKLDGITHFVLDEADRMLDMGFIHDIKRLMPLLPKNRQTLFFSATMPKEIVAISKTILNNPVRIEVERVSSVVDTIEQCVYFVEKPEKTEFLIKLLNNEGDKSVLVFSRTKHGADKITKALLNKRIGCEALHGNKSQAARQRALSNFKSGKTRIIVATDIAAR